MDQAQNELDATKTAHLAKNESVKMNELSPTVSKASANEDGTGTVSHVDRSAAAKVKSDGPSSATVYSSDIMTTAAAIASDKIATDKMSTDKIVSDKISTDKIPEDKMPIDKIMVYKMPADKIVVDKTPADKIAIDKMSTDKNEADKLSADKIPTKNNEDNSSNSVSDKGDVDKMTENEPVVGCEDNVASDNTPFTACENTERPKNMEIKDQHNGQMSSSSDKMSSTDEGEDNTSSDQVSTYS